ncbi:MULTISPECIES: LysR family transcriptional regulator [Providencia]|uniref:LysR family transcriptional regulator n=1 Tax=Providencia stuartii TaxID=588 RepID=A0AAI9HXB0_PROST|nr:MULTISPECIES: LysR family transcriptional regulator [Providencia]ELR5042769.1 LysR family transcriptional regulator [Providencia rettgeri]ELR5034712.1 LysR family transcriptional regulator [Providencia stuartii]ELR5292708.1 LysR family transcriptional regulator [Providencia stuartii]ELZ5940199.1 LysR family transcriptional regulator [Providencia stuartii]MCK1141857.1 LysR family transcriptional regulator [Providencia stuartii]
MNSESLKIFCMVAEELSITRAATRLGRVPSNITTRIQQLETDLGEQLFIRQGKQMQLSQAGLRFLQYAYRLLALEQEARHVTSLGKEGGQLRIGSMESTAACRLPQPLATYHKQYPETQLCLTTGTTQALIDQIRTEKLDCAFVALPPDLYDLSQFNEIGIQTEKLWQERLVLLLPEQDKTAKTAEDIQTRSLATFAHGCSYRYLAEQWLNIPNQLNWHIQQLNSYHAMVACVSAGSSVALLPEQLLESMSHEKLALATLDVALCHTYLIYRSDYHVPAFAAFKALMLAE